jgi:hypothetical protein
MEKLSVGNDIIKLQKNYQLKIITAKDTNQTKISNISGLVLS